MTPRRLSLVSVPGLRAFHRAVARLCASPDAALVRRTAILVPTRSAALQLRNTLERLWLLAPGLSASPRAVVFPEILTRADWYRRLLELAGPGWRMLSEIEREVLLGAAAREAIASGTPPPFRMRPGLVAEMLAFYDALRRQQKDVDDFDRLTTDDLAARAEFDRGAERLLRQTRFLAAAFRAFEARLQALGALDEHLLRQRLLADAPPTFRRAIVTMGDRVSEPSSGLYPADFDVLSRLPSLESVDIVATRNALLAGLGERVRALVPDVEEQAVEEEDLPPILVQPRLPGTTTSPAVFTSRDREEELRDIARRIKADLRTWGAGASSAPRVAVVFRRPLPYVYLGRTVFGAAGIECQAVDALPLAAEPFAAALNLVFGVVAARFARGPLVQFLRSPHWRFADQGLDVDLAQIDALDRALAKAGYLGGVERLQAFAEQSVGVEAPAARAAAAASQFLLAFSRPASTTALLDTLLSFVKTYERLPAADDPLAARHLRARGAVLRVLTDLRAAAAVHDDPEVPPADLAAAIRRWLESQTFTPTHGDAGVVLADASAARYGDFDDVHLAGLVAGDWPEAAARNIFYPSLLLGQLGWPPEAARLSAERAVFADLLRLARERVSVSSFTLEDDSIVEPSPLLEEIERSGLTPMPLAARQPLRIFSDEAMVDPAGADVLADRPAEWHRLRAGRPSFAAPRFHGFTSEPVTAKVYTVTGIDRYLECPFKYFARTVLGLPEDAADEQGLSPAERGRFVHEVFRAFFTEWQASGRAAVSVDDLDAARALFARVVEEKLPTLPGSEAPLERMRLLGTAAAPGLGEIVLAAEAVRPGRVARRLLEFPFEGAFTLASGGEERTVRLRGKADRVDLLADGRLRVIDYKTGRAPDDSIQLPIYALCLRQHLGRRGRPVLIGEALYIAFGDRRQPVEVVLDEGPKAAAVLERAQARVVAAVEAIERGEFPPRPAAPRLCGTCAYAAVCRKDVVVAD